MCVIKNNNKNACNKWQNWWGSWLYLTLFYVISEKVLAGMCGAAIYNIMSDTIAFSIHWEKKMGEKISKDQDLNGKNINSLLMCVVYGWE